MQKMIRVDAWRVARVSSGGPMSHPVRYECVSVETFLADRMLVYAPTRQPVAANDFPAEPTVKVRSHMPGRAAIRTCSVPS